MKRRRIDPEQQEQQRQADFQAVISEIASKVSTALFILYRTGDHFSKFCSPAEQREYWKRLKKQILREARSQPHTRRKEQNRVSRIAPELLDAVGGETLAPLNAVTEEEHPSLRKTLSRDSADGSGASKRAKTTASTTQD